MGRPTTYNDKVAEEICYQLIEGKSLAEICRQDDMPAQRTVYQWLKAHEGFAQNYTRAREDQADTDADAISDIAAEVRRGELDPAAARAAIDAYKWTAGKRKPKVYGDKMDLNLGGEVKIAGVEMSFVRPDHSETTDG